MDVDHSDDDWLEGAHDGQQQTAADKEWGQLEEKFSNEGYREGITSGKLANLQAGFDEGYVLAASAARQLGFLRGSSSSLLSFLLATPASRHPGPTSPAPQDLDQTIADTRALIGRLARLRAADVVPADEEAAAHAREHDGVDWDEGDAKEMDDLGRALENVGTGTAEKDGKDAFVLGQLEETLEALLDRAGLRA